MMDIAEAEAAFEAAQAVARAAISTYMSQRRDPSMTSEEVAELREAWRQALVAMVAKESAVKATEDAHRVPPRMNPADAFV